MVWGTNVGISCGKRVKRTNILYRGVSVIALTVTFGLGLSPNFAEAQNYRFNNVQVEGNQRIQSSTIVAYTGIERGKTVSAMNS